MRGILKGTLILTAGNLTIRSLSYVFRILMGRMLPVYEFGLLNIVLPLQFLIIVLSSSGISPSIAKFVSEMTAKREWKKRDILLSSSAFYFTLLGILAALFFIVIAEPLSGVFNDSSLTVLFKVSALAIPFGILIAVFTGAFQGIKRYGYMSATLFAEQASRIIFAIVLVYFGYRALDAIWGSTLGFIAIVPLGYIIYKKFGLGFAGPDFSVFRSIFTFSIPVSITSVFSFFLAYVDILLIGFFMSPYEVGIYSAASPTSRLIMAFSAGLYAVILPGVAESWTKASFDRLKSRISYSYKMSLSVLIPALILSLIFSKQIIGLLFPPMYSDATEPFRVLVVGTFFLGIFTLNSGIFQGLNRPEIPMKILFITLLLDITLNVFLIPEYGVLGAAWASTISFLFSGIVSIVIIYAFIKKTTKIS